MFCNAVDVDRMVNAFDCAENMKQRYRDGEKAGAFWHIWKTEDAETLRDYIKNEEETN